jgi:hypothetical protein
MNVPHEERDEPAATSQRDGVLLAAEQVDADDARDAVDDDGEHEQAAARPTRARL